MTATAHGQRLIDDDHQRRLDDGVACLAAALDYLARGWPVLPLCNPDHVGVGRGHNCDNPGKVPVIRWKEFQGHLPTEDEVRGWWRSNPLCNVGGALGPVSGLVRVDVDGPSGEAKLLQLSGGDLPPTLEFTSGRPNAGRGLLYAIPPGVGLRTTYDSHAKKEELRFQAKGRRPFCRQAGTHQERSTLGSLATARGRSRRRPCRLGWSSSCEPIALAGRRGVSEPSCWKTAK